MRPGFFPHFEIILRARFFAFFEIILRARFFAFFEIILRPDLRKKMESRLSGPTPLKSSSVVGQLGGPFWPPQNGQKITVLRKRWWEQRERDLSSTYVA